MGIPSQENNLVTDFGCGRSLFVSWDFYPGGFVLNGCARMAQLKQGCCD